MSALIGFFEKEISILDTHSGGGSPFAETVEIFGEDIDLVLTLMEDVAAKTLILRTVAISGV